MFLATGIDFMQIGIDVVRDGEADDPVEGANVTLICRMFTETEFSSLPEWSYRINNTGQMQVINETSPHEGTDLCKITGLNAPD